MRNRIVLLALCAGLVSGGLAFAQDGDKTITFWHHTYTVATDWDARGRQPSTWRTIPACRSTSSSIRTATTRCACRAAIAAGDPPDILNVLDYLFPEFYEKGWLAPVDPEAFGVSTQQEVVDLFVHPALVGHGVRRAGVRRAGRVQHVRAVPQPGDVRGGRSGRFGPVGTVAGARGHMGRVLRPAELGRDAERGTAPSSGSASTGSGGWTRSGTPSSSGTSPPSMAATSSTTTTWSRSTRRPVSRRSRTRGTG